MAGVDALMETCPLKHEIRVKLWAPFIQKLRKKGVSYLTLYSPPLMDVKYLHTRGFILHESGVYSNVVGVTIDKDAFADATGTIEHRLDLLVPGDVNDLLTDSNRSENAKDLAKRFPFDVINLDYTDALHKRSLNVALSPHFNAIETILKRQKQSQQFVLFITTYFDLNAYNEGFLEDLRNVITKNIEDTPGFIDKLQDVFNCSTSEQFQENNPTDFFSIGVLKYILGFLKDNNYDLQDAGIKWLVRDNKQPQRHMLHLALHIKHFTPPKITKRGAVGNRQNLVEQRSVNYLRNDFPKLFETVNFDALYGTHNKEITNLHALTFELQVPEPVENPKPTNE